MKSIKFNCFLKTPVRTARDRPLPQDTMHDVPTVRPAFRCADDEAGQHHRRAWLEAELELELELELQISTHMMTRRVVLEETALQRHTDLASTAHTARLFLQLGGALRCPWLQMCRG